MANEYISPARSRALLGTQMTDSARKLRQNIKDYNEWQKGLGETTAKGRAWGGYGLPIASYLLGGAMDQDWMQDPTILALLGGVGSYGGSKWAQGQYPDAPDIRTQDILFGEPALFEAEQEADIAASAFDASQWTDALQDMINIFRFMGPEDYEFADSPIATGLKKAPKTILDFLRGSSKESGPLSKFHPPQYGGSEWPDIESLRKLLTEFGYYEENKTGRSGQQSLTY